jgi:hypothetical protein
VITLLSQMRTSLAGLALGALLVAGCQDPDVGQPCTFDLSGNEEVPGDYLETGKTECENLVCIRSPTRATGYCSKPCVATSDCSQSDTGLVCRPVVVDQNWVQSLTPEQQQKYNDYLGSIQFSNYCALPLP